MLPGPRPIVAGEHNQPGLRHSGHGARCSAGGAQRMYLIKDRPKPVLLDLQVIASLQVHPESLRGPEVPGQTQPCVGADAALTVHDLVDPPGRDADLLRQLVLAHAEGIAELLEQDRGLRSARKRAVR